MHLSSGNLRLKRMSEANAGPSRIYMYKHYQSSVSVHAQNSHAFAQHECLMRAHQLYTYAYAHMHMYEYVKIVNSKLCARWPQRERTDDV